MYFISFTRKRLGLTNQLFILSTGIKDAIKGKSKVVVIDKFLCDFNADIYENISNVLDLDEMNLYFEKKYNLILVDKYNFNFELLNVRYGTEDNNLDITKIIKEKYTNNNKLLIDKNIDWKDIVGEDYFGVEKYIWFKYKVNEKVIIDKYSNKLTRDIDYTNDNYTTCGMDWPSKKKDIFEDILMNIRYKKMFHDKCDEQLSDITLTDKVNIIHLRIETDGIIHWSKMNKMSQKDFKTTLENRYIELIEKNIDMKDTTIILSSSFDNRVVDFLNENGYNYLTSKNYFKYRELNAIVDTIISKKCNNIFIGNFNIKKFSGSTFTYYIKETLTNDIIYEYVDLDDVKARV